MKISVIIPTWNFEKTVGKTIESLLGQSCLPGEIIIADGGSSDKALGVYSSFNSPLIRVLVNRESHSAGSNRNMGAKAAIYDFLVFLDSDCVADVSLIKNYEELFQKHICIAGNVNIQNPGKIANFAYMEQKAPLPLESGFIKNNFFWTINFGIRKEAFIDFIDASCAEDLVFINELVKKGVPIWFSKEALVYHPYPDNLFDYFNKKLFYAKGFLQQRNRIQVNEGSHGRILVSLLDRDLEELRNMIENGGVSFDLKGKIAFLRRNRNFMLQDLLCLTLVVAVYENKGGKISSYKELVDSFCKG